MKKKYSLGYLRSTKPLSKKTKDSLAALFSKYPVVDVDRLVVCVEHACQVYLGQRDRDVNESPQKEIREKLKQIRDCTSNILALLEEADNDVRFSLNERMHYQISKAFTDGKMSQEEMQEQFDPHQRRLVKTLRRLLEATNDIPDKSKAGRPTGSINKAGYNFGNDLYRCCKEAGIQPEDITNPITLQQISILHLILNKVRNYLRISSGELNGIFRNVIKDTKSI